MNRNICNELFGKAMSKIVFIDWNLWNHKMRWYQVCQIQPCFNIESYYYNKITDLQNRGDLGPQIVGNINVRDENSCGWWALAYQWGSCSPPHRECPGLSTCGGARKFDVESTITCLRKKNNEYTNRITISYHIKIEIASWHETLDFY